MTIHFDKVPKIAQELTLKQVSCLVSFLEYLEHIKLWNADEIQKALLAFVQKGKHQYSFVCETVYLSFIGKKHESQIGDFLSGLDKCFVISRLEEVISINTERLDPMFSSMF